MAASSRFRNALAAFIVFWPFASLAQIYPSPHFNSVITDAGVNASTTALTNAALQALSTVGLTTVTRMGVNATGDASPLTFTASNASCSLNSGAGDVGTQVPSADGKCWLANAPAGGEDVREWGAKCTGASTDDSAALEAAGAAGALGLGLIVPNAICYSSVALSFGSVTLSGARPLIVTNPPSGPTIECPASIAAACVTTGTASGGGLLGATLRDIAVAYSGTPVAGDQAIAVQGFNSQLDDVLAYNAWDGYTFENGISAHANHLYTWNIYDDHVVQNGFPELYITHARLGMNGSGDQAASNAFIGITGANPNGLVCTDCQMNLGGQSPKYFYDFNNLSSQSDGIYVLSDSVVDMSAGSGGVAIIHSDGSGTCYRCMWTNVVVNAPSLPFWSMGSITTMNQMAFSNDNIFVSSFTMPTGVSGVSYLDLRLSNLFVSGSFTLNAASGSNAVLSNIMSAGNMTINGTWSTLDMSNMVGANYSDSAASGNIHASNVPLQSWTPAVATAGGGETVAYTTHAGKWTRTPTGGLWASYNIALSSFSGGSGSVEITGMPETCTSATNGAALFSSYSGLASGLTTVPWVSWGDGQSYFNVLYAGAGTFTNVPASDVTSSTALVGAVTCGTAQ